MTGRALDIFRACVAAAGNTTERLCGAMSWTGIDPTPPVIARILAGDLEPSDEVRVSIDRWAHQEARRRAGDFPAAGIPPTSWEAADHAQEPRHPMVCEVPR